VGATWADLVDRGYNAYLVPDPYDGGSFAPDQVTGTSYYSLPDGGKLESTVNNDGSGWLAEEVSHEAGLANAASSLDLGSGLDLSFIGYSWGGGVVAVISNYLVNVANTPGISQNVYVATIDPITYGANTPLLQSPATTYWNGFGENFYETNPLHVPGVLFRPCGVLLPGIPNTLVSGVNHWSIGSDPDVLMAVESDLISFYGMLNY
jgi:hypothetical protein